MKHDNIILITFNGITIAVSVSCFFICLFVVMVHKRKEAFRKGLFRIVFSLAVCEMLLNVLMCLKSVLHLLSLVIDKFTLTDKKWFEIIIIELFTFILNVIVFYHIGIIHFLRHYTTDKYPDDNQDIDNDTIKLNPHSFSNIHYLSFIGSTIITLLFLVILCSDDCKYIWKIFFYKKEENTLIVLQTQPYKIICFIVFVIIMLYCLYSFISSGLYCCSSICNKDTVSDKIYLKSFALYALCYTINWIAFQVEWFIIKLFTNEQIITFIISIVFQCLILILLIVSAVYRWKCYYIQSVFGRDDDTCLKKLKTFMGITFCKHKPKGAMIVDYNSLLIMHSLATYSDLIDKEDMISELDSHVGQSLIVEN